MDMCNVRGITCSNKTTENYHLTAVFLGSMMRLSVQPTI